MTLGTYIVTDLRVCWQYNCPEEKAEIY